MKVITIGRDPNCNVVINDPQISRRHAILRISDLGKIEVVDMSSNGTSVNGNPLRKNVPYHISRKDQVTFAGVSKLNWEDIPNPIRLYKWIGIALAGLIALTIIILMLVNSIGSEDNEEPIQPQTTIEQTDADKPNTSASPDKVSKKPQFDTESQDEDYKHLLKPIEKPHLYPKSTTKNEDASTPKNKDNTSAVEKKPTSTNTKSKSTPSKEAVDNPQKTTSPQSDSRTGSEAKKDKKL